MILEKHVGAWMSNPAITISPKSTLTEAHELMKEHGIRHLPVVEGDRLVGLLSSGDIRRARPSDAISLSVWELNYLWDKLTAEHAMTRNVVTTTVDTPLVEVVRMMMDRRFSSVPVVDPYMHVVGIVTEVDIFRAALTLFQREAEASTS